MGQSASKKSSDSESMFPRDDWDELEFLPRPKRSFELLPAVKTRQDERFEHVVYAGGSAIVRLLKRHCNIYFDQALNFRVLTGLALLLER
jgi:hypothetical protein